MNLEPARPSDFPKYDDGDVVIVVSSSKTYQLHASVLRRNSPFFAVHLDRFPGVDLLPQAKRDGITARYRFELTKSNGGNDVGTFERRVGTSALTPWSLLIVLGPYSLSIDMVGQRQVASSFLTFRMAKLPMDSTNTGTGFSDPSITSHQVLMTGTLLPRSAAVWD